MIWATLVSFVVGIAYGFFLFGWGVRTERRRWEKRIVIGADFGPEGTTVARAIMHGGIFHILDISSSAKPPPPKSSADLCVCGHRRAGHIYEEGACRPGFRCASQCPSFREKENNS